MIEVGDRVAVFDSRCARWRAADVVSVVQLGQDATATVATARWWAIVPVVPAVVRPVRVVGAASAVAA